MRSPMAEFFVDVFFSTTHALRVFWKVLPRALGRALYYKVGVQHVLSHCSAAKCALFWKKVTSTKRFRRGTRYLQSVQERSGVAQSCLSTLGKMLVVYNMRRVN